MNERAGELREMNGYCNAATQTMRPFGCYRIIVINLEFAVYLFCVSNVENSHNVHAEKRS